LSVTDKSVEERHELVETTLVDGVAVIQVNNPPVNALSAGVPAGIASAIEAAEADANVQAIVLRGAGKTFVAGADIKQLEEMAWGKGLGAPNLHQLLQRIENCSKPVVMAIHGTALGGGLELAMAGHYRVAVQDAQFGQPEVNLGIIPGAEGTQRLPRLAGIEKAIEMCVSGKPVKAPEALAAGIIDEIVQGDLTTEAAQFARLMAKQGLPHRKTRELAARVKGHGSLENVLAAGREQARKTKRNLIAPLKAVEAIAAAATLPFDQGCALERHLFQECVESDQCRALIHSPNAVCPRFLALAKRRPCSRSIALPSWALERWAPALPWPAPTRAFQFCSRKRARTRSMQVWRLSSVIMTSPSSADDSLPRTPPRALPGFIRNLTMPGSMQQTW